MCRPMRVLIFPSPEVRVFCHACGFCAAGLSCCVRHHRSLQCVVLLVLVLVLALVAVLVRLCGAAAVVAGAITAAVAAVSAVTPARLF